MCYRDVSPGRGLREGAKSTQLAGHGMDQEIHEDQEINKDQQNGRKFLRRTCNEHLEGNDGSKDK